MNSNGSNRSFSVAEVVAEDDASENDRKTPFFDPANPALAPAQPIETGKKKSWKRKLIGWGLVLLLVGGGGFVLYELLKIKQVNVRVTADSRRDAQSAAPKPSPSNSENGLSAEAINIARQAVGADIPAKPNSALSPGSSPDASPAPSPADNINSGRNLSATLNLGLGPATDFGATNNNQDQADANGTQPASQAGSRSGVVSTSELIAQSRANGTQSIFVDDSLPKAVTSTSRVEPARPNPLMKSTLAAGAKTPAAVLPPFGTMLPVRTQGVIFTLRNNSYARLELTRDAAGTGWALPKGTVLVGRTSGSEHDRAFVNVIGYIDPRENRLVKMSGEVLGSDGATGIPGKRLGVDRNRLKQTLRKVASSGLQVAGLLGGGLGRGTVILDRSGYPIPDDIRQTTAGQDQKNAVVKVEAGQAAYVMVADLPKSIQATDAPGDAELLQAANSLSDREVMELILLGSPDEVRAALPIMTDDQRSLALKAIGKESQEK